jgi:lipopolysaccharide biosynthesis glycosyltransferase
MNQSLFIGYDPRENQAFEVCAYSARKRASQPLTIQPIKLDDMHAKGFYTRPVEQRGNQLWDPISEAPMSTEFAISRFLVPHLSQTPWAVFCDCDFLWLDDIAKLFALADNKYAVMCVQHNHVPTEKQKMDGQAQVLYARKNWSSLMLWNCQHPSNKALTLEVINKVPGRDLHRFFWLKDEEIGALPYGWNWLEGHSDPKIKPHAVHYTRGGPWFDHMKTCDYAAEWLAEAAEMEAKKAD